MIDLHTHSRFSDGSDTPSELAQKAAALGLNAIALTDHDTTASHDEMAAACSQLGLELVAGVEVSLKDVEFVRPDAEGENKAVSVHVLGYFFPTDSHHPLQLALESLRSDRDRRNRELVTLLNELGFTELTFDYLVAMAGSAVSIGRPHFATAMFELHPETVGPRSDENWSRVFYEWLGQNGRAYIPKSQMTIEQFVAAGQSSGVVFSIAHPLVNYLSGGSHDEIARVLPGVVASLRRRGIAGVEAYYGSCDEPTRQLVLKITRDAGMIPTGGSDYHGTYKQDVALGRGRSGDLRVPDEVLDELKSARQY